jgi:sulfur-carrier protein
MIRVLLFAHLQEEAGSDHINIDEQEITIGALKEKLKETYHFTQLDQVMAAINEEYALNDDIAKQGDTIAFIPPVSGG